MSHQDKLIMSSGPKISPRKFSEKIALLNKKTEEGNAKFEEIIKEVQSTKSQQAPTGGLIQQTGGGSPFGRVLRKTSQEEVEAVYESLIRSVNQYDDDDEPADTAQGRSFSSAQAFNGPMESHMISENHQPNQFDLSIRSASAEICHAKPTNQLPLNTTPIDISYDPMQQQLPSGNQPLQQQQLGNTNYDCTEFTETHHQLTNDLNCNILYDQQQIQRSYPYELEDSIPNQAQIQQQQQPTSIRARVTSIGSAHYNKYMGGNVGQQVKGYYNQGPSGNWQGGGGINSTGAYLSEPCEKSWQKSSSDPALHVLPTPFSNINSCSDMAIGGTTTTNTTTTNSNLSHHPNQEYQLPVGNYSDPSRQAGGGEVLMMEGTDLPGIKICPFEDDGQQLASNSALGGTDQNTTNSREEISKDGSLPDISNLQFSMSPDQQQTTDCLMGQAEFGCQRSNPNNTQSVVLNQNPAMDTGSVARQSRPMVRNAAAWPIGGGNQLKNTNNNNLSHSTSGLSMHQTNSGGLNTSDLYDSIMRSHSHNSIDHLTRQKISSQNRIGPYPQHHHSPQYHHTASHRQRLQNVLGHNNNNNKPAQRTKQRIQQQHQHPMQPPHLMGWEGGQLARCCSSSSSMRPQRGSMSPLGSSSNLASPQSEANSPGGCGEGNSNIGSELQLSYDPLQFDQQVANDYEPPAPPFDSNLVDPGQQATTIYQQSQYHHHQQQRMPPNQQADYLPPTLGQSQQTGDCRGVEVFNGDQRLQQADNTRTKPPLPGYGNNLDSGGIANTSITTHSIHGVNPCALDCGDATGVGVAPPPLEIFSQTDGLMSSTNINNTTS